MKILNKIQHFIIVVMLSIMVILNFANVISRKLLHYSLSFTEEMVVMCFVWISMLGIALAYSKASHLGMDYIVNKFNSGKKRGFVIFSAICSIAFMVCMVFLGIQMVKSQAMLNSRTPSLGMPEWWQGLSVPVGGALSIISIIDYTIKELKRLTAEAKREGDK